MNDPALAPWLRRFLDEHLCTERNLALNSRLSYRDTFLLLLPFLAQRRRKSADRLTLADLDATRVLLFLNWLETERGCAPQTRNLRLSMIRMFVRFVASRSPEHLSWCASIRAIHSKKAEPRSIGWLSREEMEDLLAVPDRNTERGFMEHALLLFLYNTGARVSEVTTLRGNALDMDGSGSRDAVVTLLGKGRKRRPCPLWKRTVQELEHLVKGRSPDDPVFRSRREQPYSRFGIYRMVERCAAQVPALEGRGVTPHVLRHTAACHLLQSGVDINTIRAWLGHVSLDTTHMYAEIDLRMKMKAVELCGETEDGVDRPWKRDPGVMDYLRKL